MALTDHASEFRVGWRALLATSLGLASGMALYPFLINILAPHLVEAMGWTKSQFAMAGMVSGLSIFAYPMVGRLADRFGVRVIGGVGVAAISLSYIAIAMLNGPIGYYIAIMVVQILLGTMTTGPVFLRLVVRGFDRSRGVALAIAVSTPAIVAALASPLFAALIENKGWRFASFAAAAYALTMGIGALALIPAGYGRKASSPDEASLSRGGIRQLFGSRAYRLLLGVTALVSMPLILTNSQLALVLVENGMTTSQTGAVLGLFAAGTIAGRFAAGIALDRYPAKLVGAVSFVLPAIGMMLLASPFDQYAVLATAILLIGISFGAEGDVLAYIVSRLFNLESYGTALGTIFAAVGVSAMVGAFVLSQALERWDGYNAFLIFGSASVVLGSVALLFLSDSDVRREPDLEHAEAARH